jgi:hypothetical protein
MEWSVTVPPHVRHRIVLRFPQCVYSLLQYFQPCENFVEGQRRAGKHFLHLLIVLTEDRSERLVGHDSKGSGHGSIIMG